MAELKKSVVSKVSGSKVKGPMKWVVRIVGALVLLVGLALILPFLIDLNKFKPQIQEIVAQNVNARLDFESARLQIIPGLGVKLKKVLIENTDPDFKGTRLFYVDEIFFQTELMPLFKKKFSGEVHIVGPEIVFARKMLKNNATALAKPAPKGPDGKPLPAPVPTPAPQGKPTDPAKQAEMMKLIKENVVIKMFEIKKASLIVKDMLADGTKQPVKITDLNLKITNIGLDRDIKTELSTMTAVAQSGIKVGGPFKILINSRVKVEATGFQLATFDGKVDLDSMDINAMDAFVKPKGIALNVEFKGNVTPKTATVEDLRFNLHNLALTSKLNVKDLTSLLTEATFSLKNNDLSQLGTLLPQHKNLLMKGTMALNANVNGPLSDFKTVKSMLDFNTRLANSDLALALKVDSLEPYRINLAVNSNRIDLGALLKPFMPPTPPGGTKEAAAGKDAGAKAPPAPGKPAAEAPEKEFELSPEVKKMLAGADINVKVNMGEFIWDKIQLTKFVVDAKVEGTKAQLRELSVNGFGGNVKTSGLVDLGPSPITFANKFAINQVNAEEFIGFIKPEHKDLLKGRLTINLDANGKGTTRTSLNKTLNGKGAFQLQEGELHTPSVAQAMQTEFDKFIGGLSIVGAGGKAFDDVQKLLDNPILKKIPQAQSAQGFDLNRYKTQYQSLSKVNIADKASVDRKMKDVKGNLEIKNGRIFIQSSDTLGTGTFAMNSSVGIDSTLGGGGTFVANDALKSKMKGQSPYANLLFDEKGALILNLTLSGMVSDPKVGIDTATIRNRFTANAKALVEKEVRKGADDYINKLTRGGKDAAIAELKKKADEFKNKAKAEADARKKEAEDKGKDEAKKQLESQKSKLKLPFGN